MPRHRFCSCVSSEKFCCRRRSANTPVFICCCVLAHEGARVVAMTKGYFRVVVSDRKRVLVSYDSFGLVREQLGLLTHQLDLWLFKSRPERYVTKKNKKERGAAIGIVLLGMSWIQVLPIDLLSGRATAAALRALLLICCYTCCSYSVISELLLVFSAVCTQW